MRLLWDERKRLANIVKHGMDFAELDVGFFLDATYVKSVRAGRFMGIGEFNGVIVSVVYSLLGAEGISVISMRPASVRERSLI